MKSIPVLLFFILVQSGLPALDFWQYPEAADKNAVFLDLRSNVLSFSEGFRLTLPEFSADYVLPVGLPFSIGAYFKTPDPNLKSFGLRLGYHINIDDPNTDIYLLYIFDFGFLRNDVLLEYNDEAQEIHWYDFRAGIRYEFGLFCLALESDYKLQGLNISISLKLN
jgi:hypothetical protein